MRTLYLAAAVSAAFMAYVATASEYRASDDPSAGQAKGWRSCLSEETTADSCTTDLFPTLAACKAYNTTDPYAIMDGAECFDNIDEVPVNQGGYAVNMGE